MNTVTQHFRPFGALARFPPAKLQVVNVPVPAPVEELPPADDAPPHELVRESDGDPAEADPPSHADVAPVYHGMVRLLDYNDTPRSGMTAKFLLIDGENSGRHPFKGLKWARKPGHGHRLRLVISQPSDDTDVSLYIGEGELAWWTEDCANGMSVVLRFDSGPDGADVNPLKNHETGAKEGETAFLACWAVADDETPQPPEAARKERRPYPTLTAIQQSHILCKRDDFRSWCASSVIALLGEPASLTIADIGDPGSYAAAVVRLFCGVVSRSEFGKDTEEAFGARSRWDELQRRFWRDNAPR